MREAWQNIVFLTLSVTKLIFSETAERDFFSELSVEMDLKKTQKVLSEIDKVFGVKLSDQNLKAVVDTLYRIFVAEDLRNVFDYNLCRFLDQEEVK